MFVAGVLVSYENFPCLSATTSADSIFLELCLVRCLDVVLFVLVPLHLSLQLELIVVVLSWPSGCGFGQFRTVRFTSSLLIALLFSCELFFGIWAALPASCPLLM